MIDLLFLPLMLFIALGVVAVFKRDWSVYRVAIMPVGLVCVFFALGFFLPDSPLPASDEKLLSPDLFLIVAIILFACMMLALSPLTRQLYERIGSPVMLICSVIWLGIMLADEPPLTVLGYIVVIVLFSVVNWKRLINRMGWVFRRGE